MTAWDAVGHAVDLVFVVVQLGMQAGVIVLEQLEGSLDIDPGGLQDREQEVVAALEGKGRGMEEDGVQLVGDRLVFALLDRLVLDYAQAELLIDRKQGQEQQGAGEIEDRVGIGDDAGIDRPVPESVQQPDPVDHRHDDQDQGRLAQVEENVDQADALGVRLRADGADDGGGHAVAEIDAHDDRVDGVELQQARG